MSEQHFEDQPLADDPDQDAQGDYGSLSIEDDPEGTVDAADLAGTSEDTDEDVR
jgi:hypothetical protein